MQEVISDQSLLDDDSKEGVFDLKDFEIDSTGSLVNKKIFDTQLTLIDNDCEEKSNESKSSESMDYN